MVSSNWVKVKSVTFNLESAVTYVVESDFQLGKDVELEVLFG